MSSLAATQPDGYYLPVAYYKSGACKKQSKNQWHDSNVNVNVNANERKWQSNHQNESSSSSSSRDTQTGIERLERTQAPLAQQHQQQQQELQALLNANEVTHKNDADGNAAIRSIFRMDRSSKKRRRKDGVALGWRPGMVLVGGTIQDQIQAKSTTYGNGKRREQERMTKLRQSEIFGDTSVDDKKKRRKRRRQQRESESTDLSIAQPDTV